MALETILSSATSVVVHNSIVKIGEGGQYRVFAWTAGGYSYPANANHTGPLRPYADRFPRLGDIAYAIKVTPRRVVIP